MIDIREHGVGGSGLTPTDSVLSSYTVANGETIKGGNLVNFTGNQVKKCYLKKIKPEIPYAFYNGVYSSVASCKIDDNRVFVIYKYPSYLRMFVMTLNNDFISQGNVVTIENSSGSVPKISLIRDNKILVMRRGVVFIATISDTTITTGMDYTLSVMAGSFDMVKLMDNKAMMVFEAGSTTRYAGALIINVSITDVITFTGEVKLADYPLTSIKCQRLSDILYLCTSHFGSTKSHGCFIINVNNGVITERAVYPNNNSQAPVQLGSDYVEGIDNIIPLSDTTALIAYTNSSGKFIQDFISITGTVISITMKGELPVIGALAPNLIALNNTRILGVGLNTTSPYKGYTYTFNIVNGVLVLDEEIIIDSVINGLAGFPFAYDGLIQTFTATNNSFIKIIRDAPFPQGMAKNNGNAGESVKVYKFRDSVN